MKCYNNKRILQLNFAPIIKISYKQRRPRIFEKVRYIWSNLGIDYSVCVYSRFLYPIQLYPFFNKELRQAPILLGNQHYLLTQTTIYYKIKQAVEQI